MRMLRQLLILTALVVMACLSITGCGDTAPPPPPSTLTDRQVMDALKSAGLPMSGIVSYTVETDPNDLLGQPDGYESKGAWHDTRLDTPLDPAEPGFYDGGSIEIFSDAEGARKRQLYIEDVRRREPDISSEYIYRRGPMLLRISGHLTSTQAEEYRKAFEAISLGQ